MDMLKIIKIKLWAYPGHSKALRSNPKCFAYTRNLPYFIGCCVNVNLSRLLGSEDNDETQTAQEEEDSLSEQLANIAEQMAIKNRRSKRIWKTIGIVFAIIIALNIIITVLSVVSYSSTTSTVNIQTYESTQQQKITA
jgi:tetrahydromethanopterin S-methyltransferase subunit G